MKKFHKWLVRNDETGQVFETRSMKNRASVRRCFNIEQSWYSSGQGDKYTILKRVD